MNKCKKWSSLFTLYGSIRKDQKDATALWHKPPATNFISYKF